MPCGQLLHFLSAGKWCGVTEVNYASGLMSMFNAFIDRDLFYSRPMKEVLAPLNEFGFSLDSLPPLFLNSELRQFLMCGWIAMSLILMALSVRRVMVHENIAGPKLSSGEVRRRRFLALSKLITPLALCIAAFSISPEKVRPRYITVRFQMYLNCAGLFFLTTHSTVASRTLLLGHNKEDDRVQHGKANVWDYPIRCIAVPTGSGLDCAR